MSFRSKIVNWIISVNFHMDNDIEAFFLSINIFDRYGKFSKQMSPASSGWDGTYNGEAHPSTDYWFTVEYLPQNSTSKQIFKSHFSLKR